MIWGVVLGDGTINALQFVCEWTDFTIQRTDCLWTRSVIEKCVDTSSKTQCPELAVLTKLDKTVSECCFF